METKENGKGKGGAKANVPETGTKGEKQLRSQNRIRKEKMGNYFKTKSEVNKLNLNLAQLDPESLAKRIKLNHLDEFPATSHPAPDAVSAFKIIEEVLKPVNLAKAREFWYVENKSKLEDMRKILTSKTVIGIDVEVDSDYSYVPIITLIQISCDTHDFVIDATKLFPFITESLQSIFLDNSIVKLVFGQNDVREFKRDFNLYFTALVDVQLVHRLATGIKYLPRLNDVVKIYLDKEMDKGNQLFPFKFRPLPDYILEYAKNDSMFLLECWEVMKEQHREYLLKEYKYKLVNDVILKPFSFSKSKSFKQEFEKISRSVPKGKQILFTDKNCFNVCMRILEWRKGVARMRDISVHNILSRAHVGKLCVEQPITVRYLGYVLPDVKAWERGWKEGLVKAIIGAE
ncbi:unnamed protein product [Orchesella dallaii]|uniref:3'-5' exonuclease domain-containing protein n=1 Tax=Orchesella dallaii TaxID=48710 RepID=A0ABP1RAT6_9HEXA